MNLRLSQLIRERGITEAQIYASYPPEEAARLIQEAGLADEKIAERQSHIDQLRTQGVPGLEDSSPNLFGRMMLGMAKTPEGKANLQKKWGIEGYVGDPVGFDWGDVTADAVPGAFPAVGGAVGAALGTPEGIPAVGAGVGAAGGEWARQVLGNALGSQEGINPYDIATEMGGAVLGEGILGHLGAKMANPIRKAAKTANIEQNVRAPAQRFGISRLPADALTESEFVGKAAARARESATPHGDIVRQGQAALRQEESDAFEGIARGIGRSSSEERPAADLFINAADATRTARLEHIGGLFDRARQALLDTGADPKTLPIVTDETLAALSRMEGRTQVRALPNANVTAGARRQIKKLRQDVGQLTNFDQMDALRRRVGDMLRNRQEMEELAKSGADRDLRDLYGGLARDLENSLDEGVLARAYGQVGGVVRGSEGAGRRGASATEATLGDESAGALLDVKRQAIDAAKETRRTATGSMAGMYDEERRTILNMLRDPGKAENLYASLFKEHASVDNIRAFKQAIGASSSRGGLPGTPEGQRAWETIQNQLFRDLRDAGQEGALGRASMLPEEAVPIYGQQLSKRLDGLGGQDVLSEALGEETTKSLYDFASFLVNASPTDRAFSQLSGQAGKKTAPVFFVISLIRRGWDEMIDAAVRQSNFPNQGKMSKWLTEGLASTPRAEGRVRAVGTFMGEPVGAGFLGGLGRIVEGMQE